MHPVLQLLAERSRAKSRPGQRDDGHRLGLAIQGGGMRGVVSAGMVRGLESLGMLDGFDAVYGSSAGAINGAFFVANQAALGMTIYYENINNRTFLDPLRLFTGKPFMSLEFLLDHVMVREKPLDWKRVVESPVRLKAVASPLDGAGPELLDSFRTRDDLFDALRASARVPYLGGPPVPIGDRRFLDALLFEQIPFDSALRDGCSHVLVLRSVPARVRFTSGLFDRWLVAPYLRRMSPGLDRIYLRRFEKYAADQERLQALSSRVDGPPFVLPVGPPESSKKIFTIEKRREVLVSGAKMGIESVRRLFSGVLALLAVLFFLSCSGSVPELPRLPADAVIVAYGDSLTYGTGARPEESYPAVLAGLTGRKVINAGSPGEESDDGLERLPGVLEESRPDLLILCHGGNDFLRKGSEDEVAANVRGMIREARSRGIPVVLIGVPEPGLLLSSADLYEHIADQLDLPYDGEVLPEILAKRSLKSDLIHPNRDGYRKLAEAIRALLAASGAVEPGSLTYHSPFAGE